MSDEKMCAGRVCVVTGTGRGIGHEHTLMLAGQGARVVVNDLGGSARAPGTTPDPRNRWWTRYAAFGGEAVANTDDISDWSGAEKLVRQAIDHFGGLDVVVNKRGSCATG